MAQLHLVPFAVFSIFTVIHLINYTFFYFFFTGKTDRFISLFSSLLTIK